MGFRGWGAGFVELRVSTSSGAPTSSEMPERRKSLAIGRQDEALGFGFRV